jgi:protein gp37
VTDGTRIEWTDASWNPIRGCSRVSEGCRHCYAETVAHRFSGPGLPYEGLTNAHARWNGTIRVVEEHLVDPLRWTRPRRVFVNSMSDLFHESLTNKQIAAVFGIMAAAAEHTFQVLTKRPERMRAWFQWVQEEATDEGSGRFCFPAEACRSEALKAREWRAPDGSMPPGPGRKLTGYDRRWPLPNVWLGVSVEDQATADARIPLLLHTPAALRFISAEPLLGPINLTDYTSANGQAFHNPGLTPAIDWVIVGGESGAGARPCDVAWVRALVQRCAASDTACFVKQLGSRPVAQHPMQAGALVDAPCADRKGGDMAEWPDDLRVRQFPGGVA